MAQDCVARIVLGRTKVGKELKLTHSSSKSSRRRKNRAYSRDQPRPVDDTRRTVVVYGDASIRGTYLGNTPIQCAAPEKAIVNPVDEIRISVTGINDLTLFVLPCTYAITAKRSIVLEVSMATCLNFVLQRNVMMNRTVFCLEQVNNLTEE
ncbi:hypothetical protein BD560DRAFT_381409 [Blakeslea trispora]|nr:hypothetical protein BD560DRAFT_381409 [Blakeslea trispora]